jgi:integrase
MSAKAAMTSFTQDELVRLMTYMHKHDKQMHAICLLALGHAMRRGEVLNLSSSNFVDGRIVFDRLKGSEPHNQPLLTHEAEIFDEVKAMKLSLEMAKLCPDGRMLFTLDERQVNRLLVRYGTACGIHRTKLHLHSFKHSCVRFLLDAGMRIDKVQAYVGHADGGNTLRYTRPTDAEVESEIARLKRQLAEMQPSGDSSERGVVSRG